MKKLWQKNEEMLDSMVESFETKDDLVLDQKLLLWDIYGTMAHAQMLAKIHILTADEYSIIHAALLEILTLDKHGKFILQPGDEDIHTKIENYVTETYGDVGKKMHTGRSRNDQVLTALRLYYKNQLLDIWNGTLTLADHFLHFAKKYASDPMPGYTHMQKAMPSTVGMWALAFTESLLDDVQSLMAAYALADQSPLGSAAGFGVPLPLDRHYCAEILGFGKVQVNPIYCQNSRGKIEGTIAGSLIQVLQTINKFATDIVVFTTQEFGYFSVDAHMTSGSSIMPQKKNVDIAELLKSKVHVVLGLYTELIGISSNLLSGYNRDLQDTKKPMMEGIDITMSSIHVTDLLLNNLVPDTGKLQSAMTPTVFATHMAFDLVKRGMSFREAYMYVGNHLEDVTHGDMADLLDQSTHIGGTGNLGFPVFEEQIQKDKNIFAKEYASFIGHMEKLVHYGKEVNMYETDKTI